MVNIALIGCTGSIGRQACEIVRRYPERFRFSALVCGKDKRALSALCAEFRPDFAALASGEEIPELSQGTRQLKGEEILSRVFEGCGVAMIAAGGFAGLSYTLRGVYEGKRIALANNESLVCGGELVLRAAD